MLAAVIPIHEARSRRAAGAPPAASAPIADRVAAGERLYTAAEIGRHIGRSAKSLQRDRAAGMPAHRIGTQYRYVLADVLAWHQRREGAAAPDQSCA